MRSSFALGPSAALMKGSCSCRDLHGSNHKISIRMLTVNSEVQAGCMHVPKLWLCSPVQR
jgi:hypothetical protein